MLRPLTLLLLLLAATPLAAGPFAPYDGAPLPPFELRDMNGTAHTIGEPTGEVVVVNFWATWCPPCVAEMPTLERLQDAFAGHPLRVLAVNVGDEAYDIALFLRQRPLDLTILLDERGRTQKAWKMRGLPTTVILDAEGTVRYHVPGQREWDSPAIQEALRALLPAGAPARQAAALGG